MSASILLIVQRATETTILQSVQENALNLMKTVVLNVDNQHRSLLFHKNAVLERKRIELKNIVEIGINEIRDAYDREKKGLLSRKQAQQLAKERVKRIRYDKDVGYLWINDMGRPIPKMIMHPLMPELDGKILDDPKFNCALGSRQNLFKAFVDKCIEKGEGFVDYLWPKHTAHGISEEQSKLSFGRLFRPWGWVLGTGLYIDDINNEVEKRMVAIIDDLKRTFSKVKMGQNGYMFVFNGSNEFIIHPQFGKDEGLNLVNPNTGNLVLDDLKNAAKTPTIAYEYKWDKPPLYAGVFNFWKRAYVQYYRPLDWYIASSVYIDESEQGVSILRQRILFISAILLVLAVIFSFIFSNSLSKPVVRLTNAAQKIKQHGLSSVIIPVEGTSETKKLGLILGQMIRSLKSAIDEKEEAGKSIEVLFNIMPIGVMLVDRNMKIQLMNGYIKKMIGYEGDDIIGKSCDQYFCGNVEAMCPYWDLGEQVDNIETVIHDVQKKAIPVLKSSMRINFRGQEVMVETFVDMSNIKKIEKEKIEMQKQVFQSAKLASIGELAAGVAHEINNPLAIINGYIDVLKGKLKKGELKNELIQKAIIKQEDAVARIANIVDGLRTYARMDTSYVEIIDLHQLIEKTVNMVKNLYENKNIELDLVLKAKDQFIKGNIGKFQQILMNFLSNAKDAIGDKTSGKIKIETINRDRNIIIKISDNGHGILPENMNKIFETFFTTKSPGEGTGLGLGIVQSLVTEMGGNVEVDSEYGLGTTFTTIFPTVEEDVSDLTKEIVVEEGPVIFRGRVLVVEDEGDLRELLQNNIIEFGLDVDIAKNGADAIRKIQKNTYNIIITDLKMPEMSGDQMILELDRLNLIKESKIVVITGGIITDYSIDERAIIRKFAFNYLKKPFKSEEIYKVLRDCFDILS